MGPLVAPLASLNGVSAAAAQRIAAAFPTGRALVGASEDEIADVRLESGRRAGKAVAARVKAVFSRKRALRSRRL